MKFAEWVAMACIGGGLKVRRVHWCPDLSCAIQGRARCRRCGQWVAVYDLDMSLAVHTVPTMEEGPR